MKTKDIILMFVSIFLLFMLVFSIQFYSGGIKPGLYVLENTDNEELAWVLLNEDDTFVFNRHLSTSYRPSGTYVIKDNTLTLYANESELYIFNIKNNKLIFESGTTIKSLLEKGTTFILKDE
ncbi:MAG: hypothetical protein KGZ96_07250 [Clostridia bacterium]|nr:hypothetical protein [Clostridia bacterium]